MVTLKIITAFDNSVKNSQAEFAATTMHLSFLIFNMYISRSHCYGYFTHTYTVIYKVNTHSLLLMSLHTYSLSLMSIHTYNLSLLLIHLYILSNTKLSRSIVTCPTNYWSVTQWKSVGSVVICLVGISLCSFFLCYDQKK